MNSKIYAVYILASERNGTLYIGMTGDLEHRVLQHKNKQEDGFTKQYGVDQLVYYDLYESPNEAIAREKQLKKWNRSWKLELIEKENPEWHDLYEEVQSEGFLELDPRVREDDK